MRSLAIRSESSRQTQIRPRQYWDGVWRGHGYDENDLALLLKDHRIGKPRQHAPASVLCIGRIELRMRGNLRHGSPDFRENASAAPGLRLKYQSKASLISCCACDWMRMRFRVIQPAGRAAALPLLPRNRSRRFRPQIRRHAARPPPSMRHRSWHRWSHLQTGTAPDQRIQIARRQAPDVFENFLRGAAHGEIVARNRAKRIHSGHLRWGTCRPGQRPAARRTKGLGFPA